MKRQWNVFTSRINGEDDIIIAPLKINIKAMPDKPILKVKKLLFKKFGIKVYRQVSKYKNGVVRVENLYH